MKYDPKDIPAFQEQVCKKTCIVKGKCIDEGRPDHFFLMCPHYHSWKIGYGSFVWDQLRYQAEHPEEIERQHQRNVELAQKIKNRRRQEKTVKG